MHTAMRQPHIAVLTGLAACVAIGLSLHGAGGSNHASPAVDAALALLLGGGVVFSHRFPVHVRRDTNVYVYSVPAYLCTVLLPPEQVAVTIAVATVAGELWVRKERGGELSDVVTQASRWTLLALLGALVAHPPVVGSPPATISFFGAAFTLWTGDMVTSPLLLTPITGEPPARIVRSVVAQAGQAEAAQYLVGILGGVAASHALWTLGIIPLPIVLIYRAYKSANDVHERTRQLLASVVETSSDGILLLAPDGEIILANRQAAALHGNRSPDDLAGLSWLTLIEPEERERVADDMRKVLAREPLKLVEYTLLRQESASFAGEVSWSLITDRHGRPQALTCVVRDGTDRKEAARHLEFQALHDALTGLPNRTLYTERLGQALALLGRDRTSCAVFLMDLNGFKQANDAHGHHAGDVLLQRIAERLQRALRDSDTVARLGGDEFAVLLPKADAAGSEIVAKRIVEMMREPFELEDGLRLELGISIGIAVAPEHGLEVRTLLAHADAAMYAAKRLRSGSAYAYWEPTDVSTPRTA